MNVLLITSPAPEMAPFSTSEKRPPLGVGSLISTLRNAGHTTWFEDLYLLPFPIFEDATYLTERSIDFVGIYSSTVTYPETLKLLYQLEELRNQKKWNGKIIMGGPHTSFGAQEIPDSVDFIVIGEGEITLLDIIEQRISNRITKGIPVKDMNTLPDVPWGDFIYRNYDWTAWGLPTPVYTFNTSRGCPFSCSFCSVKGIWGRTYRFMSAERVLDDIAMMVKYYGLQTAYFREDHFTLNTKRVTQFSQGLLERGLNIAWACETRADSILDESLVALMAQSGCKCLYIGVESGSQRMLDIFCKGETVEQFEEVFRLAKKYDINVYASFVHGAPGETDEDRQLTQEFIERTKPYSVGNNVYTGLPGSALYDEIVKQDLLQYEDPVTKIRYLKGHNERVLLYYGNDPTKMVPDGNIVKPLCSPPSKSFIKKIRQILFKKNQ